MYVMNLMIIAQKVDFMKPRNTYQTSLLLCGKDCSASGRTRLASYPSVTIAYPDGKGFVVLGIK